jgi:two-component system, NtrC family, response regulator PilR
MAGPKRFERSYEILGESPAVKSLKLLIQKIAPSKTNVLILGESGTGKELVARTIHAQSGLADGPFMAVNCGAIPENLLESELFGHVKGSFTGAFVDKVGLFQAANQGTLFLDEVGELPLSMQVKLLRVIQDRSIRKVGGNDTIKIDVRLLAATNRDLEKAVEKGTFREDLYYRLNVLVVRTPPLRERGEDISLLAKIFAERVAKNQGKETLEIDPDLLDVLQKWSWPGNIRELENVMERAVTLETGNILKVSSLPEPMIRGRRTANKEGSGSELSKDLLDLSFSKGGIQLDEVLGHIRNVYIQAALAKTQGDVEKASKLLGISPDKIAEKK